jgi:hypothetical protein
MTKPTLAKADVKQTEEIELTYDFNKGKVSVAKAPKNMLGQKELLLKPGELLTFSSLQGKLELRFSPSDAFEPSTYRTGDPPVKLMRRLMPDEERMIWCGGEFIHKSGANAVSFHIDPGQKEYGVGVKT